MLPAVLPLGSNRGASCDGYCFSFFLTIYCDWVPCLYCDYWVRHEGQDRNSGFFTAVLCAWCKGSCVCRTVWPMSAEHWWCSQANSIAVGAFRLAKMELPTGLRGCGSVVHLISLYLHSPRRLVSVSRHPWPGYYCPPLSKFRSYAPSQHAFWADSHPPAAPLPPLMPITTAGPPDSALQPAAGDADSQPPPPLTATPDDDETPPPRAPPSTIRVGERYADESEGPSDESEVPEVTSEPEEVD